MRYSHHFTFRKPRELRSCRCLTAARTRDFPFKHAHIGPRTSQNPDDIHPRGRPPSLVYSCLTWRYCRQDNSRGAFGAPAVHGVKCDIISKIVCLEQHWDSARKIVGSSARCVCRQRRRCMYFGSMSVEISIAIKSENTGTCCRPKIGTR